MKLSTLFVFLFVLTLNSEFLCGQNNRKVAVLDMVAYNPDNSPSRSLAPVRILRAAGIPFTVTDDLSEAVQFPIIITGSRIDEFSFNTAERSQITDYVQNGGVLVTSNLRDPNLFALSGITSRATSNTLYEISFDTDAAPIFDMIDDPLETTVSLGDSTDDFTFYTQFYGLGSGTALAHYEDGSVALVKNNSGQGAVYLFGPDFRDISYRNQTDFDVQAERTYSNGFEPTTDVFFFLIRNIVRAHIPHTVSKYTIPYQYSSALMITHDVDSQTAIDTMQYYSDFEQSAGISALYNITTRYFHDALMSNFYIGSWNKVQELINDGHVLGSHSVGHFPDFDKETLFPLGDLGNTVNNYSPSYHLGITSGGSVLGELEVSKNLLENDHNVEIRSFRPGHLAYNDSLALGLEMTDYEFSSSVSANSVLTSFPFYAVKVRTFDGVESSILEIPMTISDVFDDISAENYSEKVDIWLNATLKYNSNHSPVVLLIHPNRMYKLSAQMEYLDQIPENMVVYPFEDYGEYWRKRDSLEFRTEMENNTLLVQFENDLLSEEQSFVVDFDGLDSIEFVDESGNPVSFNWVPWDNGTRLYFQDEGGMGANTFRSNKEYLTFYPNPTSDEITVDFKTYQDHAQLILYDLSGRILYSTETSGTKQTISLSKLNIEPGMYILKANFKNKTQTGKVIYQK